MPKISQIDEVPCQAEVRILQKITLNDDNNRYVSKREEQTIVCPSVANKFYAVLRLLSLLFISLQCVGFFVKECQIQVKEWRELTNGCGYLN